MTRIGCPFAIVLVLAATRLDGSILAMPQSGTATIDGDIQEWNLVDDFFADMYRAGKTSKDVESKLYLRYDGFNEILYALVLSVNGQNVLNQPDNAFIKLGNSTKLVDGTDSPPDGSLPDFAWYNLNVGSSRYEGWEAAVSLPPGDYGPGSSPPQDGLNVHVQVFSDGESQTSAVADGEIPLWLMESDPLTTPPIQAAPEPATFAVWSILGLCGIGYHCRRKRKAA